MKRYLVRAGLAAVALAGAVVLFLAILPTPVGRALLRRTAQWSAGAALNGRLTIGAVEGSPYDALGLRDVVLYSSDGRHALAAKHIEVAPRLSALWRKTVHIHRVQIVDLELDWPVLQEVLPKSEPSEAAERQTRETIPVVIDHAALTASKLTLSQDHVLTDVAVTGTATIGPGTTAVSIDSLTGARDGLSFALEGALELRDDAPLVLRLDAQLGDIRIRLAQTASSTQAIDLEGRLRWPAGAVAAVISQPDEPAILRASADLAFSATGAWDAFRARVSGALGRGHFELDATGPVNPISVRLQGRRIDAARIHDAAPTSSLDLTMTASVSLQRGWPRGHARLALTGTTRPVPGVPVLDISRAQIAAESDGTHLTSSVVIESSAGRVEARGRMRPFSEAPRFEQVQLRVDDLRLGSVVPAPVSGTITATVTARGPMATPRLTGRVAANGLTVDGVRIGKVASDLQLAVGSRGLSARWTRFSWTTPTARWTSSDGAATLDDGRVFVPPFILESSQGRLRAGARFDLATPFGETSSAAVELSSVDLSAFRALSPSLENSRGRLDGVVRFDGETEQLVANVEANAIQWTRAWPETNARIDARIDPTITRVDIDAEGLRWGHLRVDGSMATPTAWRDPAAWTSLSVRRLERLSAEFELLMDGAFTDQFERGRVQGAITIGARGASIDADVSATRALAFGYPEITKATLTARSTGKGIQARLAASVAGRPALNADATVYADLPQILEQPWSRLRADLDAQTDRFPVELLGLRLPWGAVAPDTAPPPIAGVVSMQTRGRIGRRGPRLAADIEVEDLRLAPGAPAIKGKLSAVVNDRTATASVAVRGPELGQHSVRLRSKIPAQFDAAGLADGVESLRFEGRKVSVAALGAFAGLSNLSGTIDLTAEGKEGLRSLNFQLTADEVGLARALVPLHLDARLTQTATQTQVEGAARLGAAELLRVRLVSAMTLPASLERGTKVGDWPIEGFVKSTRYPLRASLSNARLTESLQGFLSLDASVRGVMAALDVDASVDVDGLQIGETRFTTFRLRHQQSPTSRLLEAAVAASDGGKLDVSVDARDPNALQVDIAARAFSTAFLSTLADLSNAGTAIDGRLDGTVTGRGSWSNPEWRGRLVGSKLRVAFPPAPRIDDGRLELKLDGRTLEADLEARSGAGTLAAALKTTLDASAPKIDGKFALDDVQIATAGQVMSIDLEGKVSGDDGTSGIDASVVLVDGFIRLPDRSARELHPITDRADVVFENSRYGRALARRTPPAPTNPLGLRIRTAKPLGIRGEPVEAVFNLDLVARRAARGVSVRGNVRLEQGTVTLFGRRYTAERAEVILGGALPARPRLDVLLSYEFEACTFYVGVSGLIDNPKLTLSARPDIYDDRQLLGFLFGASPDRSNPDKTPQQQGIDSAAGLLLGQLQSQLKKNLPIDTLTVDLGDGTTSGQANVSLGKWITDRLFVAYTYRHGAAQTENTSEGLLRYRFFKRWLVELVFGDRGNGAADVLWTERW